MNTENNKPIQESSKDAVQQPIVNSTKENQSQNMNEGKGHLQPVMMSQHPKKELSNSLTDVRESDLPGKESNEDKPVKKLNKEEEVTEEAIPQQKKQDLHLPKV